MIAALVATVLALVVGLWIRFGVDTELGRGVLMLLAVVVVVASGAGTANADPGIYLAATLAAIVLLLAAVPGGPTGSRGPSPVVVVVIVLFGLNLVVTAIANPAAFSSVIWPAVLAVLAVVVGARLGPRGQSVLLAGVAVVALVEALLSVAVFVSGGAFALWTPSVQLPNPLLGGIDRATGTLTHPILLGAMCAIGAVAVLSAWRGWARWAGLAVLLAGMVLSGSRSSILAIVLSAAFLLLSSARPGRTVRVVLGAGVGAAAVALSSGAISESLSVLVDSGSYTNRAGALESLPALFDRPVLEHLFGAGFGSEPWLREQGFLNQNGFESVDNQFVTTVATQGIVGLVVLVALVVVAFRSGDRFRRAVAILFVVLQFTYDDLRSSFGVVLLLGLLAMRSGSRSVDDAVPKPVDDAVPNPVGDAVPNPLSSLRSSR